MDMNEIIGKYKEMAARNDANAQFELGMSYACGQHVPQDSEEGNRLIRLAANQGHPGAQRWLAAMGPRNPIANWLYVRGGAWDKFRKVVAGC